MNVATGHTVQLDSLWVGDPMLSDCKTGSSFAY